MSIQELEHLSLSGTSVANSPESAPTIDDICDVIGSERRRWALRALASAGGELEFPALVDRVAELEFGKPIEAISSKERMRVYAALKQSHLPKMRERGAVEFDPERITGTIRLGETADEMFSGIVLLKGDMEFETNPVKNLVLKARAVVDEWR